MNHNACEDTNGTYAGGYHIGSPARQQPTSGGPEGVCISSATGPAGDATRGPSERGKGGPLGFGDGDQTSASQPADELWHTPQPEKLPQPSYWPVVMALAIVFSLWGFVTTFIISGVGLLLFIVAISGWIGEMRHEQERERRAGDV
jgi:hypothetical protein